GGDVPLPYRQRPPLGRRPRRGHAGARRPVHDPTRHAPLVPRGRCGSDRVRVLDAQPRRERRVYRPADRSIAPSASCSSTAPGRPLTPTAPTRLSPSKTATPPRKNVKNGSKLARSTGSSFTYSAISRVV